MRFAEIRSPVSGMRVWNARAHGYSFVITLETTGDVQGYTCSWKALSNDMRPFGKQPANDIIKYEDAVQGFLAAERACKATLKQLLQKN